MFYELLTGERPFRGGVVTVLRQHVLDDVPPLPLDVVAQLDPRVLDVLQRLLAKTPDTRLGSADELFATLGAVILRPELPPPSVVDPTVVDPQPFGSMNTMVAGAAGLPSAPTAPTAPTALAGLPAIVTAQPPSVDRKRPAWVLPVGLALAALMGLLFVGAVLRSVLSKPDATDAANPASSSASSGGVVTKASDAPIDLPPPPRANGTSTGTAGTGTAGTADDEHPSTGTTASANARNTKDTKGAKPKGRKTGPFGIYIPPPKEW